MSNVKSVDEQLLLAPLSRCMCSLHTTLNLSQINQTKNMSKVIPISSSWHHSNHNKNETDIPVVGCSHFNCWSTVFIQFYLIVSFQWVVYIFSENEGTNIFENAIFYFKVYQRKLILNLEKSIFLVRMTHKGVFSKNRVDIYKTNASFCVRINLYFSLLSIQCP